MNSKIFSHFITEKNYLLHNNIVQQHFLWNCSFQSTHQADKLQKFEMVGGMTSTPMEIPGGGGLKQNCSPWWGRGVNIFWECIGIL